MIPPAETRIYHKQLVSRLPGASEEIKREARSIEDASARLTKRLEQLQARSRNLTAEIYKKWPRKVIGRAAFHLEV